MSGTCLDMSKAPVRDEKQGSTFLLSRSGPPQPASCLRQRAYHRRAVGCEAPADSLPSPPSPAEAPPSQQCFISLRWYCCTYQSLHTVHWLLRDL